MTSSALGLCHTCGKTVTARTVFFTEDAETDNVEHRHGAMGHVMDTSILQWWRVVRRCLAALSGIAWLLIGVPGCVEAQRPIVTHVPYLSALENDIIREINRARQHPTRYAGRLEALKGSYDDVLFKPPGAIPTVTQEGSKAVDEALHFLRTVAPRSPLTPSYGMSLGARLHVRDQGPKGTTGHRGNDGSQVAERVSRYGTWQQTLGENIAYGRAQAQDVVIGLIIDDGVPNRGHRHNLFNPAFHSIGVSCGDHLVYRTVCVLTFAGGYQERTRP